MMIKFAKIVEGLPSSVPFIGPESQERINENNFLARLGANESVFGPSPKVVKAIKNFVGDLWKYSDPESYELKNAIAKHENTNADNIIIGEGIDGLLGYLCRLFVDTGVSVVTSQGAYPTFNYHALGFGGKLHFVPYKNDYEDLDQLISVVNGTGARLLYVSNPDNPMGTFHESKAIEELSSSIPETTILCLDEAYSEFVPKNLLPRIDPNNPNVIRMRTFSKGYGMAGARIGYAIGAPELIQSFDKIRNHFGINLLAQKAALIALDDQAYLKKVILSVNRAKKVIENIAYENGLEVVPSFANFVAIDCGRDGLFAKRVLDGLIKQRIFVRMPFYEPQNRCIRLSVGKPADLELFRTILPKVLN